MIRLISIELRKMFKKPRTYLGLAAFLFIDILVLLGLRYGGLDGILEYGISGQNLLLSGSPINAIFFAWLVMGSAFAVPILSVWMPFFVSVVSGEIVAGEYADGSLRTLLTRPVNRLSVLWAKFIACIIYCLVLALFLTIVAYILGWIWFGRGGLISLGTMSQILICWYPEAEGARRLLMSCMLTSTFSVTIVAISLFISVWLNNSVGAIGGTMLLTFLMAVIGEIPYFENIRPYLFTTYVFYGQNVFLDPIPKEDITQGLTVLGTYIVVFFVFSLIIFKRKDVLA